MRTRGFTLIECLIGLSLSLFVVCACLEFFGAAQKSYFKLKEKEEATQSALAALDKMGADILRAGEGLVLPVALGLIEPIAESGGGLQIIRAERTYELAAGVGAGDARIPLSSTTDLKPGREICLVDASNGEVLTVSAVESKAVVISTPAGRAHAPGNTSVILLEKILLNLDARQGILRRKVNLSPAQPLLENAGEAGFFVDRAANLVRVRLSLNSQGDAAYELQLFPKNPALAGKG
jgi:prepilin-type N-terminal cleavage/methylation domain-containing protein